MAKQKDRSYKKLVWGASAAIALLFVSAGVFAVKILVSDDGGKRIRQIQQVQLVKPPPPPKIKEEPPPEVKEEEIVEPEPEETPPEDMSESEDDAAPPGENLGLDADGTGGGDAFGLVGKKGGRSLILGDGGDRSLFNRFGWYVLIIQDELKEKVKKKLEENGGIEEGNLQAIAKIDLDEEGRVTEFAIVGSSGSHQMDNAVKEALKMAKFSEPPPEDMPRTMKIKVTSKG